MRTLHVDTGREMGGGQWQVVYLLDGLKDATLLARKNSPLYAEASRRGIDVQPLSYFTLRSSARDSDVVHAHDAGAHTMAAILGVAPLIVSRRVAFPVKRGFLSLWKYSNAALYLAVSKFVAGRLIDAGIRSRKIRVVHDGVPIPPAGTPIAGKVVALRNKAPDLPGVEIHWAGDSGQDFWRDLSTASVFVYASELEGLGSAAIAAMACGVPVVACGAGGLSEVIEDGVTGLRVKRGQLAAAVRKLLDNRELARQMGLRGRERAVDRFSVDAMRAATVRAYEEVTRKP